MSTTKLNSAQQLDKACETLLRAAIQAPSGDNVQPWRFIVDSGTRRIGIYLDESRDTSPMNCGQRMSRIAVGAALENMVHAADGLGWSVQLEQPCDGALALLRIVDCEENTREIPAVIFNRVTNRRVYDGRPLSEELQAYLARERFDDARLKAIWIHQADRIEALADLVGKADALMLGEPGMRRAFLANVRFDAPWDAKVDRWLPLGSLELSAGELFALRIVRFLPNWLLRLCGAAGSFAAAAQRLVASSAGLCLITESDGTNQSELQVGRAVQRLWLTLAERGIAVQPMMSLAILESLLHRGSPERLASLGRQRATNLVNDLRRLVPELEEGNLAFLFRFGFAPAPTVRTGRLEILREPQRKFRVSYG